MTRRRYPLFVRGAPGVRLPPGRHSLDLRLLPVPTDLAEVTASVSLLPSGSGTLGPLRTIGGTQVPTRLTRGAKLDLVVEVDLQGEGWLTGVVEAVVDEGTKVR